jgi:hypothetical protein
MKSPNMTARVRRVLLSLSALPVALTALPAAATAPPDTINIPGEKTLATSKLFSIPIGADGKAGTVAEVKLDREISHPDGMRSFGKSDVLIVEGGTAAAFRESP